MIAKLLSSGTVGLADAELIEMSERTVIVPKKEFETKASSLAESKTMLEPPDPEPPNLMLEITVLLLSDMTENAPTTELGSIKPVPLTLVTNISPAEES